MHVVGVGRVAGWRGAQCAYLLLQSCSDVRAARNADLRYTLRTNGLAASDETLSSTASEMRSLYCATRPWRPEPSAAGIGTVRRAIRERDRITQI